MAEQAGKDKDAVNLRLGVMAYKDTYYISYLHNGAREKAFEAYKRGRSCGSALMDYRYTVVDNGIGNDFGIIRMSAPSDYRPLAQCLPLEPSTRGALLNELRKLVQKSVFPDSRAIYYNARSKRFKVLDYNYVSLNIGATRDGFLESCRRYLDSPAGPRDMGTIRLV